MNECLKGPSGIFSVGVHRKDLSAQGTNNVCSCAIEMPSVVEQSNVSGAFSDSNVDRSALISAVAICELNERQRRTALHGVLKDIIGEPYTKARLWLKVQNYAALNPHDLSTVPVAFADRGISEVRSCGQRCTAVFKAPTGGCVLVSFDNNPDPTELFTVREVTPQICPDA